ncbi:hypothetical protein SO802_024679 [Lithocarpus litseifolius]|uniref:Aminotransferase-like plant mobile domain-containing protein n=1 Tax=Lithocarpus litseifolius TaxID=425828 RepID=A0AAW2CB14_9ROSI
MWRFFWGFQSNGEAIVGTTNLTWAAECRDMLGIATNHVVLKGQRIQIKRLLQKVDQGLLDGATEVVMHQYALCYILALLGDTIFADKSGDRVHTIWLQMLKDLNIPPWYSWGSACLAWLYRELCRVTDRGASQIGGALILVQYWAWVRFPFLCPRMDLPPDDAYGPPFTPPPLSIKIVWVVSIKNSPAKICLVWYRRDVWTARVPLVCFWLVEKHTPEPVVHQLRMVQEIPPNVDTDDALHAIDLRGKINVNWRDKQVGHIQVANHKQMLTCYAVGSPEYKQITTVLKPYASSTPEFPPPPHASPAQEFPPPPHASPSPEIPPRTAHAVPNLEIPLPTTHASSHPEIPSPTPRTFSDPAHLLLTPPSFDLGIDFNETPPVMHTQSPLYNIGHIYHVPPHSDSMSFMPTPGLHTNPMITGLTHILSATPSSPAVVGSSVVGSQAKQPDVHVEHEQVVGLPLPPQGRPKGTRKPPSCGTSGHKAGHNAGPTDVREPRVFGFVQDLEPADAAEAKYHMDDQILLGHYVNGSWFLYASNDVTNWNATHECTSYGSFLSNGRWNGNGNGNGLWDGYARHECWAVGFSSSL